MWKLRKKISILLCTCVFMGNVFQGCAENKASNSNVAEIEIVQYKPEAATYFKKVESKFNATHKDVHLKISSPNDASTILRTRFIREDYPDIIGIGGDINYSYYMDADILADISDYKGLKNINQSYMDIDESLKFVPKGGKYAMPYMANAAGILYNKDVFDKYGWKIPNTWSELMSLCEDMKSKGIQPFYFGFKDTWTCLAPWNAVAVDLSPSDTPKQVNKKETTFTKEYKNTAEKYLKLVSYGEKDPCAYSYNDACTAFAKGESAMYTIGSYAVPQILSVNPKMNIDSFVMPAGDDKKQNTLNSGIDLQFCVTKACKNKKAAYEVLDFLNDDKNIQEYVDAQNAIPCKNGDFKLPSMLNGMTEYIKDKNVTDFQDHYYPSEMAVDAQVQSLVINKNVNGFLTKFDKDWTRYNRDIIREVEEYQKTHKN